MKTFKQLKEELKLEPGTQMGSNDGGIHTDTDTGHKYYVKHYENGDQAKSEVLAAKIYHHMGIHTLHPEYSQEKGRHTIITKYDPDLKRHNFDAKQTKTNAHEIAKIHHAAVLTKNWDAVGLVKDNIMGHPDGHLRSIDQGGSFEFRAQGGHKPFSKDISEKESFKNKRMPAGEVFTSTFKDHPHVEHAALDSVKNIDDKHIHHLFKNSGLSNWKELHDTFNHRKELLKKSYE